MHAIATEGQAIPPRGPVGENHADGVANRVLAIRGEHGIADVGSQRSNAVSSCSSKATGEAAHLRITSPPSMSKTSPGSLTQPTMSGANWARSARNCAREIGNRNALSHA